MQKHLIKTQESNVKISLPVIRLSPSKNDIACIVREELGLEPLVINRITDWLHEVDTLTEGTLIIRSHWEKERVRLFTFKRTVLDIVRKEEIPVPEILATGAQIVPFAYQVFRKMEGVQAVVSKTSPGDIWQRLGSLIERLHEVEVSGYGRLRYWIEQDKLYPSWREYIESELKRFLGSMDVFENIQIDMDLVEETLSLIKEMYTWTSPPRVIHGNLNLHNVLVSKKGNITGIISWDDVYFGPAPYGDLVPISLWTHISDKHRFLEGYGIMPDEWREIRAIKHPLKMFYLLNLLYWYAEIGDTESVDKILWCMHEIISER